MNQTLTSRVESKPGVCGGKPCIAGTRIRVQDIYVWHALQGQSADEIVSRFPQITMADVYAALSYYWENREAFQEQMQADADFVETMRAKYPSPLQEKMAAKNGPNTPLPS